MQHNGIYTITENGHSRNYIAQGAGDLLSVAKLLYSVEKVKRNLPKGNKTSILEGMDKYYHFVALKGKDYNLFHTLDDQEFIETVKKIEEKESQDLHVKIDYDADSLGFFGDSPDESIRLELPITAVVDAYSGSLRKKNSIQDYVNINHFTKQIEKICDAQPRLSAKDDVGGEASQIQKPNL